MSALKPMNIPRAKSHNRRYLHRFLVYDYKELRHVKQDDEAFEAKNPGDSWYPMFVINKKTSMAYHRNDKQLSEFINRAKSYAKE